VQNSGLLTPSIIVLVNLYQQLPNDTVHIRLCCTNLTSFYVIGLLYILEFN